MRQTLPTILAVLLSAGAVVYALLVVASDLRHVSDELDVVAHDMGGIADDVRSLADDVNAIADALAGDEDDDNPQQSPAAASGFAASLRAPRAHALTVPRIGNTARHELRVHRTAAATAARRSAR